MTLRGFPPEPEPVDSQLRREAETRRKVLYPPRKRKKQRTRAGMVVVGTLASIAFAIIRNWQPVVEISGGIAAIIAVYMIAGFPFALLTFAAIAILTAAFLYPPIAPEEEEES